MRFNSHHLSAYSVPPIGRLVVNIQFSKLNRGKGKSSFRVKLQRMLYSSILCVFCRNWIILCLWCCRSGTFKYSASFGSIIGLKSTHSPSDSSEAWCLSSPAPQKSSVLLSVSLILLSRDEIYWMSAGMFRHLPAQICCPGKHPWSRLSADAGPLETAYML